MTDGYSLARIIDPFGVDVFYREHWERKPLLIKRALPEYFSNLVSWSVIDHAVTTLGLSHPEVSMYNALREVRAEKYTLSSGLVDVVRLYKEYAEGSTIIMQELSARHAPLADLCRALECEMTHKFQTNVYTTPESAQGFKAHFDSHDVFVLQVTGSKHWLIYDTPVQLPYRGQKFRPEQNKPGDVTMDFVLNAGDSLYIPRGVMHDARTTHEGSIHVTLGALTTSWTDVLLEAIAIVGLNDPDFRKALPPGYATQGFDFSDAEKFFRELLRRAVEKAALRPAMDQFIQEFRMTRYPNLWGQMTQIDRAKRLTPETCFTVRPILVMNTTETNEHFIVACYGNEVRLPKHAAEPAKAALSGQTMRIRELPGTLDLEGRIVLIRRLVHEGLVEILER